MNLPELKVKQDVMTRWNSTLVMLQRLVEIKESLSAEISSLPQAPDFLDGTEWDIISDSISILKPFESMTTTLSAEKYPTVSMIIPFCKRTTAKFKKTNSTD